MSENIDMEAIREQLPHGAIVQIAKKAGVLTSTASRALHGDKRSPKLPEIIKATAEYLEAYNAKKREAQKAMERVLKG
jgi:Transcriptional regulators